MVAIRGGYRMARGWHYTKLSLSSALLLSFSGMCILLLFLSFCRSCFVFVVFFGSRWSFVDVPLIFSCPADHVPDWQPRTLLGVVETRSVNVKKTTTTCPCMAITVSVQHNGGFLPGIILLTQCYYHRGTRLSAMKRFCIICSL